MSAVSVMQPAYLPWLGYFDRVAKSDLHVVLDHVEMDKSSQTKFTNRNRVRTPSGWTWLTVPVRTKGECSRMPIRNLSIVQDSDWARKHWNSIRGNYARAKCFREHATFFEGLYRNRWELLEPLISETTSYLLHAFNISTKLIRSSDLDPQKTKSDLILELCYKVNAKVYISGPFGRDYLNSVAFAEADIEIRYHDYPHPEYQQAFNGFEPYMSAIDLLFNHGSKSRGILESPADSLKSE